MALHLPRPTRRHVLGALGVLPLSLAGGGAYARWVEPDTDFLIAQHRPQPANWPAQLWLRIAVLADLHCGSVHMPMERIEEIMARTNALAPDLILLLGDYVCRAERNVHRIGLGDWSRALTALSAPLGVHAVLGNHEY